VLGYQRPSFYLLQILAAPNLELAHLHDSAGRFILRHACAWRRHAYHAAMLSLPFAFCGRVPCLAMEEGDGVSDALLPSQPFQLVYVRRVPKQLLKAP
jgi:hypothetical protein